MYTVRCKVSILTKFEFLKHGLSILFEKKNILPKAVKKIYQLITTLPVMINVFHNENVADLLTGAYYRQIYVSAAQLLIITVHVKALVQKLFHVT